MVFLSLCRKGEVEEAYELLRTLDDLFSASADDAYAAELAASAAAAAATTEVSDGAAAAVEEEVMAAEEVRVVGPAEAADEPLALAVE